MIGHHSRCPLLCSLLLTAALLSVPLLLRLLLLALLSRVSMGIIRVCLFSYLLSRLLPIDHAPPVRPHIPQLPGLLRAKLSHDVALPRPTCRHLGALHVCVERPPPHRCTFAAAFVVIVVPAGRVEDAADGGAEEARTVPEAPILGACGDALHGGTEGGPLVQAYILLTCMAYARVSCVWGGSVSLFTLYLLAQLLTLRETCCG